MEILHTSVAGTVESSDIMITLSPPETAGIAIDLKSTVIKQFGNQIRAEIEATLHSMGIDNARVTAVDKGALDCAIRARVRAAVCRATDRREFDWEGNCNAKTA